MEKVSDNRRLRGAGSKPDCRQELIPELAASVRETRPGAAPGRTAAQRDGLAHRQIHSHLHIKTTPWEGFPCT
eukprot:8954262-Pyramimonas_sp.AAC.1